MAESERENVHDDLENGLKTLDCHFNWGNWHQIPPRVLFYSAFAAMDLHNGSRIRLRRFACCLHAAFITCVFGELETCDKLLFVANRILEHSRDPTSPEPPSILPVKTFKEGIWKLPTEEFLAKCSELNEDRDVEVPSESHSDDECKIHGATSENEEEENSDDDDDNDNDGTLELWAEDRFTGMYAGAKHLLDSLKTYMLFRDEPYTEEVEEIFASITPISQMSGPDCAFIRYIEARSWMLLGGITEWLKALGGTVLADPNDIKWYLLVMQALYEVRASRHLEWGRKVEWKDVETFLDVTDSILDLRPAQWMVVNLNFERLNAINDYMVSLRKTMPVEENQRLSRFCFNLCKKVIENTTQTEFLAYCAQILSRRPDTMDLAISTIEKAVAAAVDHDRAYINAKACNIFIKDRTRLEDALACAELAAKGGAFGSNFQVLEVKTLLGHDTHLKEFFKEVRSRCKCGTHIEQLHIGAFLHYICKTKDIEGAILHIKPLLKLASIRKSKDIMGSFFCKWIKEDVIVAEAGYNVVQYVLNEDYKVDEIELTDETVDMCQTLKDELLKHLKGRAPGRLTPKEYVRWLRGSKIRSRDETATAASNKADSGESSFWPHQKYTQQLYRQRTTSDSSAGFYGGYGNYRRRGYSDDRSGDNYRRGDFSGKNDRYDVTPERLQLSWRMEMRPTNADTEPVATDTNPAGRTNAANPGSSPCRYQPARSWRSRSQDNPDQTNRNLSDHRRGQTDRRGSNSHTGGGPWTAYPNWRNRE